MTYIYSTTALSTRQREVKDAARKEVVHITENGNGAFVFCSEEVFESELEKAREDAAHEARLDAVLSRSREDFAAGRYTEGTTELRKALIEKRAAS